MNLRKSLLVLKSLILVEILSFIWWWSRLSALPVGKIPGQGVDGISWAYPLMV